ncbi:2062_t:CDS:2, partial [Racocetra fulgida]
MISNKENLQKCDHCKGWYSKENFVGLRGRSVKSCNKCRESINNTNKVKAKNNESKQIKRCQDHAYKWEELVEVLLGFLKLYKDFEDAKPCEQIFNVEITIFLDAFLDQIETTDKDESNKIVAYQVIELISKADGYTYIYYTRDKLKEDTEPRLLRFECEDSILITIKRSHRLIYIRLKEYKIVEDQAESTIQYLSRHP